MKAAGDYVKSRASPHASAITPGAALPGAWALDAAAAAAALDTDLQRGLSHAEAALRLEHHGPNTLPQKPAVSVWVLFWDQFRSLMVLVLIAAGIISFLLGETLDAWIILAIVILNACLGFAQEFHAGRAIEALRKLSTPFCRAVREGKTIALPAASLVPGDLVTVEAGDHIPADGRVVQAFLLKVQEASLTGESLPVSKSNAVCPPGTPLAERRGMVFMGTSASSGKGFFVVTATGSGTELGKIARMLEDSQPEQTPLQKRLEDLGRKLVVFFLAVVVVVFVAGILRGTPWLEMLMTALSLAVAAIPEGLPAVVTISLAIGVSRMAKRHALIRRLPSVETLGCATVVCSDKTGTLTQNEMTVRTVWTPAGEFTVTGTRYEPVGTFMKEGVTVDPAGFPGLLKTLQIGVLCNGAALNVKDKVWSVAGDPTEGALLSTAAKAGLSREALENGAPQQAEIPFDSDRKCMSVIRKTADGIFLFLKGAPDVVLRKSVSQLRDDREVELTGEARQAALQANDRFSSGALRVLAAAYRRLDKLPEAAGPELEERLVFTGLFAMMDPPRPEVKGAVKICREAGIVPVMITGDHGSTAAAVASELGILEDGMRVISGPELDRMDQAALEREVLVTRVYARVTAEHKLRIIDAWKKNGAVVAMTGDGVNDAPAVKAADIGVAMGITGTDVTKEASDMVITDDCFTSIVAAVELGRGIYDNIVKFVSYLLSCNLAEVAVLFIAVAFDMRDPSGAVFIPLTPVQILWMNLVTDGLPAVALALDPVSPGAMKRPPRLASESLLPFSSLLSILGTFLVLVAAVFSACFYGLQTGPEKARTLTLTSLACLQMVIVQVVRAEYGVKLLSNRWLLAALASSLGLQVLLISLEPLRTAFGLVLMSWQDWGLMLALTMLVWTAGILIRFAVKRLKVTGFENERRSL